MDKRKILQEVVDNLNEEKMIVQEKLESNLNRIAEIDIFLKSIYEKENTEFKVFSPRTVESVYKEQIEKCKFEKESLEIENQGNYSLVNKFDRYINQITEVINSMGNEVRITEQNERDFSLSKQISEVKNDIISTISCDNMDK